MEGVRKFLFDPQLPLWRYCLIAVPLALIPSLVFSSFASWLAGALGFHLTSAPDIPLSLETALFWVVVLSPALETLFLAFFLLILSSFGMPRLLVACLSALLWASFHGAYAGLWFFGVLWSFFVFSCAFLAWRQQSFARGYLAAAVPHAMVNLCAVLFIVFERRG